MASSGEERGEEGGRMRRGGRKGEGRLDKGEEWKNRRCKIQRRKEGRGEEERRARSEGGGKVRTRTRKKARARDKIKGERRR